jgi:hypothetical protein
MISCSLKIFMALETCVQGASNAPESTLAAIPACVAILIGLTGLISVAPELGWLRTRPLPRQRCLVLLLRRELPEV